MSFLIRSEATHQLIYDFKIDVKNLLFFIPEEEAKPVLTKKELKDKEKVPSPSSLSKETYAISRIQRNQKAHSKESNSFLFTRETGRLALSNEENLYFVWQ